MYFIQPDQIGMNLGWNLNSTYKLYNILNLLFVLLPESDFQVFSWCLFRIIFYSGSQSAVCVCCIFPIQLHGYLLCILHWHSTHSTQSDRLSPLEHLQYGKYVVNVSRVLGRIEIVWRIDLQRVHTVNKMHFAGRFCIQWLCCANRLAKFMQ